MGLRTGGRGGAKMWTEKKTHDFYLHSDCRRVHISATLAQTTSFFPTLQERRRKFISPGEENAPCIYTIRCASYKPVPAIGSG